MKRRTLLQIIVGSVAALFTVPAYALEQIDPTTMKNKLYAKTQGEKDFIDKVYKMMNEGKLPQSSVYSAFRYALKRRTNRFTYFSVAIKKLAKDNGVSL